MTRATPPAPGKPRYGKPGPLQQSLRTPTNAAMICELIAEGKTLRQVAEVIGCTNSAIALWQTDDDGFAKQIARARSAASHILAESVVEIADAAGPEDNPQLIVNRCNRRQWLAGRFNHQYADRPENTVNVNLAVGAAQHQEQVEDTLKTVFDLGPQQIEPAAKGKKPRPGGHKLRRLMQQRSNRTNSTHA